MYTHSSTQLRSSSGQAAMFALIVILIALVAVLLAAGLVLQTNRRIARNVVNSTQSYYLGESGLEDTMLRIKLADMTHDTSNTITLDGDTATIDVVRSGQDYTITSEGNVNNLVRTVQSGMRKNTTDAEFFYGVQVGEGGLEISHSDGAVDGNVYANGTSFGSGTVTGSMTVGGSGNEIQDLAVNEDANAFSCADATIGGNLTHNDLGSSNCDVTGTTSTQSEQFEQIDFPISDEQISEWKQDATDGGTLSGAQSIGSDQDLGPVKIAGDLFIENNVTVTLQGPVWVTGNFDAGNNAIVQVDESFGENSTTFIADGNVQLKNNVQMRGTSNENSYLMVIGTSDSLDEDTAAIDVKNNLDGAILFASDGILVVHNNVALVEAMAYKMLIKKATVNYESGLEDVTFSSGPSGGWSFLDWDEIQ